MYEDQPVSGEDKKDAPVPESAHDAHDTQRNLDVGALVEGFGRRRPPQKVDQPVSAGEDAAGYYASPKPPPAASDQRVQTGRIEIRATDPGLRSPDDVDRAMQAALEAPPEPMPKEDYDHLNAVRLMPPREPLEGVETDPSKRRKESLRKRALVGLVGVGVVGSIVALAIAKASPKNPPAGDGSQATVMQSASQPTVTTTVSAPSPNALATPNPTQTSRPTATATSRPTTTATATVTGKTIPSATAPTITSSRPATLEQQLLEEQR